MKLLFFLLLPLTSFFLYCCVRVGTTADRRMEAYWGSTDCAGFDRSNDNHHQ